MSTKKVLVGGRTKVTLNQSYYKAQGGQGVVYVKGNTAYKVYHDTTKMIPEAKIKELAAIKIPIVLGPQDVLYDELKKEAIGFTMPFVKDTEYLTKMFSRNYKKNNNVSTEMVIDLVTKMRETLIELHGKGIIVGDYNEMNFLIGDQYKIPYHIDVDSYQTKNFPCTAIMDTVRDRRLPFGKFDELSDWFAWAVVTFQMFTGIHPYMGRHPKFKTTELDARMTQNISVFDPEVKMPKACQDFSAIPANLLTWYKSIFIDGKRSKPPVPGAVGSVAAATIVIQGRGIFTVDVVHDYNEEIMDVVYYNGVRYVITTKHIYKGTSSIFEFSRDTRGITLLNAVGESPIIAYKQNGNVKFFDLSKNEVGSIGADGFMVHDGTLYTVTSGQVIEHTFTRYNKITHGVLQLDIIAGSAYAFPGVIVQDSFGKCRMSIPYGKSMCSTVMIPEMDGMRVIDCKRDKNFIIALVENAGQYNRVVLYFTDEKFKNYEIRVDEDVKYHTINMMVKQNGMLVSVVDDDTLELMMDIERGDKRITDCPAEREMKLVDGIDKTLFINGTKLYSLKM